MSEYGLESGPSGGVSPARGEQPPSYGGGSPGYQLPRLRRGRRRANPRGQVHQTESKAAMNRRSPHGWATHLCWPPATGHRLRVSELRTSNSKLRTPPPCPPWFPSPDPRASPRPRRRRANLCVARAGTALPSRECGTATHSRECGMAAASRRRPRWADPRSLCHACFGCGYAALGAPR